MQQTLVLSAPPDHRLTTTGHLRLAANRVHFFMAMVCHPLMGTSTGTIAECHKVSFISNCLLSHDNEFNLVKLPLWPPHFDPGEHLRGVVVQKIGAVDEQPTNNSSPPKYLLNVISALLYPIHQERTEVIFALAIAFFSFTLNFSLAETGKYGSNLTHIFPFEDKHGCRQFVAFTVWSVSACNCHERPIQSGRAVRQRRIAMMKAG